MDINLLDFRKNYDLLCDVIIRPPRCQYFVEELGPTDYCSGKRQYVRKDFELTNPRGLKLQCSHYQPTEACRPRKCLPCVVYLHGNAGSRLDALPLLRYILPYNITMFTFDFSGCGLSEGEYISLGHFEKDDVATVIQYLRDSESVSRIALWGRSMGAATAILFAASDPSIAGLVLDSPFSSLYTLAAEIVESSQFKLPKLVVSGALKLIRSRILERAHFDIEKLTPIKFAPSCFNPALFVHGADDGFITPHHSKDIQKEYSGESNLILVEGDHNDNRPEFCLDSITIFLHNTLLVGEDALGEDFAVEDVVGFMAVGKAGPQPPRRSFQDFGVGFSEEEMLEQALALSLIEEVDKSKSSGPS
jgi:pimeloyl-ACP methyl ester carboxylesterase